MKIREKYQNGPSPEDVENAADKMMSEQDWMLKDLYEGVDFDAERKAARLNELEKTVRSIKFMLDLYGVPKAPAGCGIESRILSVLKERDTYVW